MNEHEKEAIAESDAHLSNTGLMTYSEAMETIRVLKLTAWEKLDEQIKKIYPDK